MSSKKTAPVYTAQRRQQAAFQAWKFCLQFITPGGENQVKITTFLHTGAENALSARDLCQLTGLTPRTLRKWIAVERAAGAEILYQPGGHGGYFLPSADPDQAQRERAAFYNVQRARALCTFQTLRPVARALGVPVGQLVMQEEDAGQSGGNP